MTSALSPVFARLDEVFLLDSSIGGPIQPCPLAEGHGHSSQKRLTLPKVECDVSFVEISSSRMSGAMYSVQSGRMLGADGAAPQAKGGTVIFPRSSKPTGNRHRVDLISSARIDLPGSPSREHAIMNIALANFASCGPEHPRMTLSPSEDECAPVSTSASSINTPVYRKLRLWEHKLLSSQRPNIFDLVGWCWSAIDGEPAGVIMLRIDTCGVRKAGRPVGGMDVEIFVHPAEKYEMEINFPGFGKFAVETSRKKVVESGVSSKGEMIKRSKEHVVESSEISGKFLFSERSGMSSKTTSQQDGKRVLTRTTAELTHGGVKLEVEESKGSRKAKYNYTKADASEGAGPSFGEGGENISFKRNGSDVAFDLGETWELLTKIGDAITLFLEGTTSLISGEATVGWNVSGSISILQLCVTAEWERDEEKFPAAPWKAKVTTKGKLFDAAIELKFGVALKYDCLKLNYFHAELSISVKLSGCKSVENEFRCTIADGKRNWDDTHTKAIKDSIDVSVTGIAAATIVGHGISTQAAAKSGVEILFAVELDSNNGPVSLKSSGDFKGVRLEITTSWLCGLCFQSETVALMDSAPLYDEFSFPPKNA